MRVASYVEVSAHLNEAIQRYYLVDNDLRAIGQWSRPIDPIKLLQARLIFSQRFRQLGSILEADDLLASQPDMCFQMKALWAEVRASLARHQNEWPAERAAKDLEGFRSSALDVQARSSAFKEWCDIHLDPFFIGE